MKKLSICLFLILFLLTICKAQKQSQKVEWKEFASEKGNFKILFPAKPLEEAVEVDKNELKQQRYVFSVSQPQKAFLVLYADIPNLQMTDQNQLKTFYDNIQNAIVKESNSTLINERDVFLDEKIGREFVFVSPKNIFAKYRVYLIGKRFFQIIISMNSIYAKDVKANKEVDKFMNSFRIIKK